MTEVLSDGTIVLKQTVLPAEPKPLAVTGSPIDAAAKQVALKTNEQIGALEATKLQAGGGDVEVKNVPAFTSAGGTNPSRVFADMLELQAQALEQGKYDALGNAPARLIGGRKRSKRHNNGKGRGGRHTRRHRGASRSTRRVRHSRRGVRSHRGKKTAKK